MSLTHTNVASFLVAAASFSLIGMYIYLEMQNPSPGPLSATHAQVPELSGARNSTTCHGDARVSLGMACLRCHQDIAHQIAEARGLHSRLPAKTRDQCATCHSEHHGPQFQLTSKVSFERTGIRDVVRFNHSQFDYHLSGIHDELACPKCHLDAATLVLPIGRQRFAGLKQDCQSCHTDVHRGSYGLDCGSCHGQFEPFDRAANFKHTSLFPLVGSHAHRRCQDCHEVDTPYSVPTLIARRRLVTAASRTRTCEQCHRSAHSEVLISVVATTLRVESSATCQVCHAVEHPNFLAPNATVQADVHAAIGFPLTPPHQDVACQACHPNLGATQATSTRFADPPRRADQCNDCHADPHGGQFDDPSTGQTANCLACHSKQHFTPAQFDLARHALTSFPLHGVHSRLNCDECHTPAARQIANVGEPDSKRSVRVFRGVSTECRVCHVDPHGGQFSKGVFRDADCRSCHDDQSFIHPTFSADQHDATQFPLTGAHRAVGCNECHLEQVIGGGMDGTLADAPKVTRQFHGTTTRCDACHVDIHDGAFSTITGGEPDTSPIDCSTCHTTEDFRVVPDRQFDHEQWTRFPPRAAHSRIHCADCHQSGIQDADNHRSLGKAAGRNCQDCHRDPHVGQFGPTAEVQCTQCHIDGDDFHQLRFDHQRDSRFQLDEVHARLACAACHQSQRLRTGEIATRYKPLGTECADCHLPGSQTKGGKSRWITGSLGLRSGYSRCWLRAPAPSNRRLRVTR